MDAEPSVRGTGRPSGSPRVGVRGRVASAVGGRRNPRPAVSAGDAYGDGRRPPPPALLFPARFGPSPPPRFLSDRASPVSVTDPASPRRCFGAPSAAVRRLFRVVGRLFRGG